MMWVDQNGYTYFRVNENGENPSREEIAAARCIAVHRVLAYAWDLIDDLWTPLELDHSDPTVGYHPWVDAEWNLQALTKAEHSRRTLARANGRSEV